MSSKPIAVTITSSKVNSLGCIEGHLTHAINNFLKMGLASHANTLMEIKADVVRLYERECKSILGEIGDSDA